jgi:zona occludens toxin (predicted ATPase)
MLKETYGTRGTLRVHKSAESYELEHLNRTMKMLAVLAGVVIGIISATMGYSASAAARDAARAAARAAAWAAASAAAWAAARAAAWDAARDAARDAAIEVQADLLRIVCAEIEMRGTHENTYPHVESI